MTDNPTLFNYLKKNDLFKELSNTAIHEIGELSISRYLEKDEYYFHQEDDAKFVYLLTEGRLKLTQVTRDGQSVILRMVAPKDLFGVVAILPEKAYPVAAQTVEDSKALVWRGDEIHSLSSKYPSLLTKAMDIMANNFAEVQNQLRQLATERVERRIARAILRLGSQIGQKIGEGVLIDLPISRQDLAEMSGTTIYTVSRVLSRWEKKELIEAGRQHIIIRDQHGLVQIAEDLTK